MFKKSFVAGAMAVMFFLGTASLNFTLPRESLAQECKCKKGCECPHCKGQSKDCKCKQ